MGNGPSCLGGPGQVPLLPWPRAGPGSGRLPAGAVEIGDYGVRWPTGNRKKKGEIET